MFATNRSFSFAPSAAANGSRSTLTVFTTLRAARSTTLTLFSKRFIT